MRTENIYIILYFRYELADCYETYTNGIYFTNKDKAVKYLKNNNYKYISDDKYEVSFNLHAEIVELEKKE